MNTSPILELGPWALVGAAALLLINGVVSLWLRLKMEKQLLVAALRTMVQLLLLGYVLVPVLSWRNPWLVLALGLVMAAVAARAAVKRSSRSYRGIFGVALGGLLLSVSATAIFGTAALIGVEPWWTPRYLVPLLGMLLGNSLTGISLGLDHCLTRFHEGRDQVESLLAMGATAAEASQPLVRDAVRTGMVPILNTMTVVGIVAIPGMMTGQILGGAPPEQAARYQIVIIFLIAAATAIGTVFSVQVSARALFDSHHRLRLERLSRTEPPTR